MNNKLKKNFYLLTSTCLVSGSLLLSGCMHQPNISYNDETKDPLSSFVNNLNTENKDEMEIDTSSIKN